ncbi:hypothetical protein LMH87_010055 [Akanthomyces muscarius]|uniref:Uncharacterized protein n=1 Tax=Akanthomyces muscarius TaxID=2231603 RepID=A0A9W8QD73_AKAMU|nr:hypothetical protein LMH87_010055 [Akanthomyces muscarius]KAJ4153572.1 hypothetical protein LMH87_010055 [Akanthomyces muscarius]
MQATLSSLVLLAAAPLLAYADHSPCKRGLNYCGSVLMRSYGWSEAELRSVTPATSIPVSELLFRCQPLDEVVFVEICYDGCIDAGSDRSDFCEPSD